MFTKHKKEDYSAEVNIYIKYNPFPKIKALSAVGDGLPEGLSWDFKLQLWQRSLHACWAALLICLKKDQVFFDV